MKLTTKSALARSFWGILLAALLSSPLTAQTGGSEASGASVSQLRFTAIKVGEPLPEQLGILITLRNPPPPPADEPTPEERRQMAAEGKPYLDPRPVVANLRLVENRLALLFLNQENLLVPAPPMNTVRVLVDSIGSATNPRQTVVLQPTAGGLYWTNPRVLSPPHRYRVTVFLQPKATSGENLPEEAYPTTVLNQFPGATAATVR